MLVLAAVPMMATLVVGIACTGTTNLTGCEGLDRQRTVDVDIPDAGPDVDAGYWQSCGPCRAEANQEGRGVDSCTVLDGGTRMHCVLGTNTSC